MVAGKRLATLYTQRIKYATHPWICTRPNKTGSISQSAVTLQRVAAFCFTPLHTLWTRPRARAFRSGCPPHRKRGSQRRANGWKTLGSRLHCWLRLARCTTADRMAARRKWDRRHIYLCAVEFRKRAFFLVAIVTGIALERFDALSRDNRNHENCCYSDFHTSIRSPPGSKRQKTRMHENSVGSAVLVSR